MEVAFREHALVGRDENHFGVEVGTNGGVLVEIGLCGTREYEHAVAGCVVFGHAKLLFL